MTFDDLFQTCVGEIGIDPRRFWLMTYKETILTIRGYEKRQLREWERARLIAYQIYAGITKKNPTKPIQQYLPLASDNIHRKTKEEMEAVRKFFIQKQRAANEKIKPS